MPEWREGSVFCDEYTEHTETVISSISLHVTCAGLSHDYYHLNLIQKKSFYDFPSWGILTKESWIFKQNILFFLNIL